MPINPTLQERSSNMCELCSSTDALQAYTVPPKADQVPDNQAVLCSNCLRQLTQGDYSDTNHWRCLSGSIWSQVPAVQALSYKILSKLPGEDWAQEILESVFPDDAVVAWAGAEDALEAGKLIHKDAFGTALAAGDNVILTQNLNVKGTNFIAPKGTKVVKIRLVPDNDEQIEGKINGDTIVILTKFVKKQP